jgi:cellulose synthase/poly-beta-1,6-N-acetylglucosamine synthase-like glycosyltransferase
MEVLLATIVVVPALVLLAPVLVLFIEVIAAVAGKITLSQVTINNGPSARVAVVVPAHNEGAGLLPTLTDVKSQLKAPGRLIVIADNCDDDTASIAARFTDEVIERNDLSHRGKGYALAAGIDFLERDPPDIVINIDADCRLEDGAIDILVKTCFLTQRPIQGLYLMTAPGAPVQKRLAEFAWRVKNWVRPLGANRLGLPCQLMGSGMAFPWEIIRGAKLASGSLVEDLELGIELAADNHAPLFCSKALITSTFPSSDKAAETQRARWEKGQITTILKKGPGWCWKGLSTANVNLVALLFDAAVPPLTILAFAVLLMFVVSAIAAWCGVSPLGLAVSSINLVLLLIALACSWLKYGRDILPLKSVGSIAFYALCKILFYLRLLSQKSSPEWIRTERD